MSPHFIYVLNFQRFMSSPDDDLGVAIQKELLPQILSLKWRVPSCISFRTFPSEPGCGSEVRSLQDVEFWDQYLNSLDMR